jgi:ribosomal protein S18 acetylase RimI-like enzyme
LNYPGDVILAKSENEELQIKPVQGFFSWRSFKKLTKEFYRNKTQFENENSFNKKSFFKEIKNTASNYFGFLNEQKMGVLSYEEAPKNGSQIFIHLLGIKEDYRRKGFGSELMGYLIEQANQSKKDYIGLAISQQNSVAQDFIKNFNFDIVGEGTTCLKIPMAKVLQTREPPIKLVKTTSKSSEDWRLFFTPYILREIEEISGNEGVAYFSQNRLPYYYDDLTKLLTKKTFSMYRIFLKGNAVGCLFTNIKKSILLVTLYSDTQNWSSDFLFAVISRLKHIPAHKQLKEIKLRISLNRVNKINDDDLSLFVRDTSSDRLYFFRKMGQ